MTTGTQYRGSTAHFWLRSNVLGLVAIFIALNGTAVAVQTASKGDSRTPAAQKAAKKVKRGPAGRQGPAGPAGPQGPQGPTGLGGPPSGTAAGELAGAYPNPTIGTVDGLDLAAATPGSAEMITFGPGGPQISGLVGFPGALTLQAAQGFSVGGGTFSVSSTASLNGDTSLPNATVPGDALVFGSSSSANLYRAAADTLQTDDSLEVGGNATLGNAATDTATINAGPVNLPNATSAADALTLGGDTVLYRDGANRMSTDGALAADSLDIDDNLQLRLDAITFSPPGDSGQLKVICNAATDALQLVVVWPDGSTDSLAQGPIAASCL